jgi:hypothetical protein
MVTRNFRVPLVKTELDDKGYNLLMDFIEQLQEGLEDANNKNRLLIRFVQNLEEAGVSISENALESREIKIIHHGMDKIKIIGQG